MNGVAIGLGHPLGSPEARILVTVMHEMSKEKYRYGWVTLCVVDGQGMVINQ